MVPIVDDGGGAVLDEACLVEHVSATYVTKERSPFAKIPVDGLFTAPAPVDRTEPVS